MINTESIRIRDGLESFLFTRDKGDLLKELISVEDIKLNEFLLDIESFIIKENKEMQILTRDERAKALCEIKNKVIFKIEEFIK